jgi:hypothetical protein
MCVLISLKLLSATFQIPRITEPDTIRNVYRSSCKAPFTLVILQRNFNSLDRFSKNTQISNLTKICPVVASCSMRTDGRTNGQTDMTKLIVTFRNFSNAPEYRVSYYFRDRSQDITLLSRYYRIYGPLRPFSTRGMISVTLIIYFVVPSYLTASIHTKSIRSTFRSFIPSC